MNACTKTKARHSNLEELKIPASNRQVSTLKSSLALSLLAAVVSQTLSVGSAQAAAITADFNGDGYEDLVIADPQASVNGVRNSGAVNVLYTDSGGIRPGMTVTTFDRKKLLASVPVRADRFGTAVVAGDFNGDGRDELAVGAPSASLGNFSGSGSVHVLKSYPNGLSVADSTHLHRFQPDEYMYRGSALAVGDFNNDGFEDLAVGVPGMARVGLWNHQSDELGTGGVEIYFGSASGLQDNSPLVLRRPTNSFAGSPQPLEKFGASLASGDFDGDGYDDLLVGSPYADYWSTNGKKHSNAGLVSIFFGRSSGFNINASYAFKDFNEADNSNDNFGRTLAVGNFNGDAYDDFAIGHPSERVGSRYAAGAVSVYRGYRNMSSLHNTVGRLWYQNAGGVPGTSETGDFFGSALTAADFDGDGLDDLAIGISGEDFGGSLGDDEDAGLVLALYGRRYQSLEVRPSVSSWNQDTPGVKGKRESNDRFGFSLSAGDYDSNGVADLLIGVTGETISGQSGRGIIQILTGGNAGLRPTAGQEQIYHRGNLHRVGGKNFGRVLP